MFELFWALHSRAGSKTDNKANIYTKALEYCIYFRKIYLIFIAVIMEGSNYTGN